MNRTPQEQAVMMHWFGKSWGAPVNLPVDEGGCPEDPTPVGEPCLLCEKPIKEGDRGFTMMSYEGTPEQPTVRRVPVHYPCEMRNILGPEWRTMIRRGEKRHG